MMTKTGVRQHRELTFRHNTERGRHGWLRLTPAYSVALVEQILREAPCQRAVFDPFSGSATTPLAATSMRLPALAIDINPFLVWFGRTKLRRYAAAQLKKLTLDVDSLEAALRNTKPSAPPPIHNIDRWWSASAVRFLTRLRQVITDNYRASSAEQDLLRIAFLRTAIELSNAAFNHQSLSFKAASTPGKKTAAMWMMFTEHLATVLAGAAQNPARRAELFLDDARNLSTVVPQSFDLVVTSPPYPNRMSYIRELRPYMYWSNFLSQAREAGELDWQAIGGTWGVATSKLSSWQRDKNISLPRTLVRELRQIDNSSGRNAALLATYVEKYFSDMWRHLSALQERLEPGGHVHYIVGNASFYGVVVSAEHHFARMLSELGFRNVRTRIVRKRNSKKELFEFDVSGIKPSST